MAEVTSAFDSFSSGCLPLTTSYQSLCVWAAVAPPTRRSRSRYLKRPLDLSAMLSQTSQTCVLVSRLVPKQCIDRVLSAQWFPPGALGALARFPHGFTASLRCAAAPSLYARACPYGHALLGLQAMHYVDNAHSTELVRSWFYSLRRLISLCPLRQVQTLITFFLKLDMSLRLACI